MPLTFRDIQDQREKLSPHQIKAWEARDRAHGLIWRARFLLWRVGDIATTTWKWVRHRVKLVFYRKLPTVDVSFDPKTGTLISNTPLPPGASLTVSYSFFSNDDEPIKVASVTQYEPRKWYAPWVVFRNGRAQKKQGRPS